jgi:2-dehydro-3-deoxyphosphogluconate aldolase/(4S)-4-hydroxy-2-oxoglutarate aldolase
MNEAAARFHELGVIPVVAVERVEDAASLADVLVNGGLPGVEVTFRTPAALEVMGVFSRRGDVFVGAGTVLTTQQVEAARGAGARFIVSPGFNPKVVDYCLERGIDVIPGICTPSEIEMAVERGIEVLKFFPAEAFGGLETLKAFSGPYPGIRFIPTGGINPRNLPEYMAFPAVLACGGTWIARSSVILAGRFDEILGNVREAVRIVSASRKGHT